MITERQDPMEHLIREALRQGSVAFTEHADVTKGLDFYLPDYDVHIEVKQFHSDRIGEQMSRAPNVIAAQGRAAVEFLAAMLCRQDGGT